MTPEEARDIFAARDCKCPHCDKPLGIETVTKAMAESRLSFHLKPSPGELLGARTVGASVENMAKLLEAVGKQMGIKTHVVVDGLSFSAGEIKVDLLICRTDSKVHEREAA